MTKTGEDYEVKAAHVELAERMRKVRIVYNVLLRHYMLLFFAFNCCRIIKVTYIKNHFIGTFKKTRCPFLVLFTQRDAATAPNVGDRVPYVIIKGAKSAKVNSTTIFIVFDLYALLWCNYY